MENEMLDDFYIEADELFNEAEDALLSIEKSDDYQASFNSVFRTFHSIKGAAGMFGFEKLQEHMHFVENLLEGKKSNESMSPKMVDYLLNAIDAAKKILKEEEVEFSYFDPDKGDAPAEAEASVDSNLTDSIKKEVKERQKSANLSGTVFVVDDEPEILEMTADHLESDNYKVKTFLSAKELLEVLKTEIPDLIITDISMPEMNGVELMKEVYKIRPHLPIVVVSGFVTKEVCMEALACGVSGVLEKPYDPDVFTSMVSVFVNRYKNIKLLNKSIDLLVYQFEDFDKFLFQTGGESKRDAFRNELKSILKQKKSLFDGIN